MTDDEYDEIVDAALVDAYGDHEQVAGFAAYIQDEVATPLHGMIAATEVRVTGFDAEDTRVVAFIEANGNKYPIDLMSIEFPEDITPIAAYKKCQ